MAASKFMMAAAMVLIAGAGCPSPALSHAQQSAPSAAGSDASALPSFEQLDKSNHGYLSRSDIPKDVDALKPLRMHFAEADANSNGRIEKGEYEAYVARTQSSPVGGSGGQPPAQPMQH